MWLRCDHTGHVWYPLSTGQWAVPRASDETDEQWRDRVLRIAADEMGETSPARLARAIRGG